MRSEKHRTARTFFVAAVILSAVLAIPPQPAMAAQGAGDPAICDRFFVGFVQRDAGTAIEWYLDHKCYFSGEEREIVVTTTEDGVRRDRFTIPAVGSTDARTTRRVELAPKPPCSSSTVIVEATYRYLDVGDLATSKRVVYYDPNDNCGA